MKHIYELALVLLCFAAAQSTLSAQKVSGRITLEDGVFYNAEGYRISDSQALEYFGQDIYEESYVGASRQYRTGRTLIRVGIPVTAAGFGLFTAGYIGLLSSLDEDSDSSATGSTMCIMGGLMIAAAGTVCLEVGIPFKIIGRNRLSSIESHYNASIADRTPLRPEPYLSLQSSRHGIGLAFHF